MRLLGPLLGRLEQALGRERRCSSCRTRTLAPARSHARARRPGGRSRRSPRPVASSCVSREVDREEAEGVELPRPLEVSELDLARVVVGEASTPTTSWPSSSSDSVRCEPMKPAQPVTSALIAARSRTRVWKNVRPVSRPRANVPQTPSLSNGGLLWHVDRRQRDVVPVQPERAETAALHQRPERPHVEVIEVVPVVERSNGTS